MKNLLIFFIFELGISHFLFISSPVSKILVGLSGGVDSAVAAALLLEQGHEVVGGYMKNWINEDNIAGDCPWEQDVDDAHAVAQKLGIEFRVLDLIDQYRDRIVDYMLEGYRNGITPNPDVYWLLHHLEC